MKMAVESLRQPFFLHPSGVDSSPSAPADPLHSGTQPALEDPPVDENAYRVTRGRAELRRLLYALQSTHGCHCPGLLFGHLIGSSVDLSQLVDKGDQTQEIRDSPQQPTFHDTESTDAAALMRRHSSSCVGSCWSSKMPGKWMAACILENRSWHPATGHCSFCLPMDLPRLVVEVRAPRLDIGTSVSRIFPEDLLGLSCRLATGDVLDFADSIRGFFGDLLRHLLSTRLFLDVLPAAGET